MSDMIKKIVRKTGRFKIGHQNGPSNTIVSLTFTTFLHYNKLCAARYNSWEIASEL